MRRPQLSDLGPWGYQLAAHRLVAQRHLHDTFRPDLHLASRISAESLPTSVYRHKSLIMRRLGNVDMTLQEGKRRSLMIAAPLVDGIIIEPGETFSFWRQIGRPSSERGFDVGVLIANGKAIPGVGGGLCQFSNLLHWMVLHSPLTVVEHHHHNEYDLFPDYNRQIPFGVGTSVAYNYIDYRFANPTEQPFQVRVKVDGDHLSGELLAMEPLPLKYHIKEVDAYFYENRRPDGEIEVRRHNRIIRRIVDKRTGDTVSEDQLLENDAHTCYDRSLVSGPIRPLADGGAASA